MRSLLHKLWIERSCRRRAALGINLLNQFGHQPRPSGLMAGAEPGPVVGVEVFKEENRIAPVSVALKLFDSAVCRSASRLVEQEEFDQPPRKLLADLPQ